MRGPLQQGGGQPGLRIRRPGRGRPGVPGGDQPAQASPPEGLQRGGRGGGRGGEGQEAGRGAIPPPGPADQPKHGDVQAGRDHGGQGRGVGGAGDRSGPRQGQIPQGPGKEEARGRHRIQGGSEGGPPDRPGQPRRPGRAGQPQEGGRRGPQDRAGAPLQGVLLGGEGLEELPVRGQGGGGGAEGEGEGGEGGGQGRRSQEEAGRVGRRVRPPHGRERGAGHLR